MDARLSGTGTRSPEERRFRRPSPRWCSETAIRLLQIASRDSGTLIDGEPLLTGDEAVTLVRAAAALDRYGQRRLPT